MSRAPLRLAVVNDYELVVAGLAEMLHDDPRVDVIELDSRRGVASTVDIVLVDMFAAVPGDGVDLEDLIVADGPLVVVYTWNTDRDAVKTALAQGVSGYLSKGLSAHELVDALECIHRGEPVVDPPTEFSGERLLGAWPGQDHGLTEREAEVLALIARGWSNPEIAAVTSLSINTIKTYVRSAYGKIGVTRRSQAVRWALGSGFASEAGRTTLPPQAVSDPPAETPTGGTTHARDGY